MLVNFRNDVLNVMLIISCLQQTSLQGTFIASVLGKCLPWDATTGFERKSFSVMTPIILHLKQLTDGCLTVIPLEFVFGRISDEVQGVVIGGLYNVGSHIIS